MAKGRSEGEVKEKIAELAMRVLDDLQAVGLLERVDENLYAVTPRFWDVMADFMPGFIAHVAINGGIKGLEKILEDTLEGLFVGYATFVMLQVLTLKRIELGMNEPNTYTDDYVKAIGMVAYIIYSKYRTQAELTAFTLKKLAENGLLGS